MWAAEVERTVHSLGLEHCLGDSGGLVGEAMLQERNEECHLSAQLSLALLSQPPSSVTILGLPIPALVLPPCSSFKVLISGHVPLQGPSGNV